MTCSEHCKTVRMLSFCSYKVAPCDTNGEAVCLGSGGTLNQCIVMPVTYNKNEQEARLQFANLFLLSHRLAFVWDCFAVWHRCVECHLAKGCLLLRCVHFVTLLVLPMSHLVLQPAITDWCLNRLCKKCA